MAIRLNTAQAAAVRAGDGPALVLAGAGSGKTRVIIERLAWLVEERGADPRALLAVTFTNRAAGELRERLAARLQVDRVDAWVGTFHAFGLYVLRREMAHLGRAKAFTVFDDGDRIALMRRLVKALPEGMAEVSPREALQWISGYKQRAAAPDFAAAAAAEGAAEKSFRALWTGYHGALLRSQAVDFDDLLLLPVALFEEHEAVLRKYQGRFSHVLVDEYQDTNRAQYLIARALCAAHGNLFVVGDEDQSIYSWRGADINNILDFSKDFPAAEVFRLEQNYRSTKAILDGANAVVSQNTLRLGKTLWTEEEGGGPIRYFAAEDAAAEAQFVAKDILERGLDAAGVAVLFRTNAQARLIEEALLKKGIAYLVVGGVKFYARKEVKDLLCYLRLIANRGDDESFRRIINAPTRGMGKKAMERVEEHAAARGVSLLEALQALEHDETFCARKAGAEFVRMIDDLTIEARSVSVSSLVELLLARVGYRKYVEKQDEKDFRTRIEAVDEFVSACVQEDAAGAKDVMAFLQDLALVSDVDAWERGAAAVTLMTCHGAKGLEFDYVYLIGLEEGLLPFGQDIEAEEMEEERRLCYVAMTRARKELTLCNAASRVLYGREEDRTPSRFVAEAGRERLAHLAVKKPAGGAEAGRPAVGGADASRLKTGTRVRHAKFGTGAVMYTAGAGTKLKARVRFDTGRTALLMVSHAPLEILEGKRR